MNAESATNILDKLVHQKRGESLNGLQRAIVQGVLEGLTYQEIKHNYPIARNYQICYLARYVAYHLWKLLTEVLKDAGIIDPDERVRNKNLWESAMRVAQQSVQSKSVQNSYETYSGTFMARPRVAVVAALVLNANPTLTPPQDISALRSLQKLTYLDPHGNPIANKICPLTPESACKF